MAYNKKEILPLTTDQQDFIKANISTMSLQNISKATGIYSALLNRHIKLMGIELPPMKRKSTGTDEKYFCVVRHAREMMVH